MAEPARYNFKIAENGQAFKFKPSGVEEISFGTESEIVIKPEAYSGTDTVTPAETTQTLKTKGTRLLTDIKINPIPERYKDITETTATPEGVKQGLLFRQADGSWGEGQYKYNFMGDDVELIDAAFWEKDILAKDTNFNTWTPSTTAKALWSASNIKTFVADMEEYEYILEWLWDAHIYHNEGATLKATVNRQWGSMYQALTRRPYGFDKLAANDWNYNYCTSLYTASNYVDFYNTSGTHTWGTSLSYGFYASVTAATFSSATADKPTVTIKTPLMNARCNNSYFSTARAAEVDKGRTRMKMKGNLYRVKAKTSTLHGMFAEAVNIYNNPL